MPKCRWRAAAGATSAELAEIKSLKATVRRLEEDNAILKAAAVFFASTRPPQPLMMGFIDQMRAEGFAVESICRVLREQGCQVAARTYRSWRWSRRRVAARTISDARVVDAVRALAWVSDQRTGKLLLGPEGPPSCPPPQRAVWTGRCGCWACPGSVGTSTCGPRSRPRTGSGPATC